MKLSLIFIAILFNNTIIQSKIIRKHKHPGSEQSSHPDIEIEPLTKTDLNENIDIINNDSNAKEENSKNNQEQINHMKNQEEINKAKNSQAYYYEDDEYVYGQRNPQNSDDSPIDFDQEIKKSEGNKIPNQNQNQNNIHNKNTINNNGNKNQYNIPNFDPEKERIIREQREQKKKSSKSL